MDDTNYSGGKEDFEWAVKLNRVSLNLVGLWPNPEENSRGKLMSNIRTFLAFLLVLILLVPCIHSLIRIHSNMMLIIENLQYTLPFLSTIIKLPILWWKKNALISIVNMIVEDWLKSKNIHERNTMIKWALRARIIITCTYLIIMMAIIFIFGLPIFGKSIRLASNITDSDRPLALQGYYIYDITKSPQYELTLMSQCISFITICMLYTGIDNFFGLLVFHICGQLDIIRNRLKHSPEHFRDMLKNIMTYHIRLLRAISTIENAYNVILLTLFLYVGIIFAFSGFLIVTLIDESDDNVSFMRLLYLFLVITSLLGHMSIYCIVGEALISECNEIRYAMYDYEWYSLDPRETKNLIPFMIKISEPVYFTAGKIFPITLATFGNLIKTSAGYISVLLTTKKN